MLVDTAKEADNSIFSAVSFQSQKLHGLSATLSSS